MDQKCYFRDIDDMLFSWYWWYVIFV